MTVTPSQLSSESTTPRPKRGWLQFNLRTLLVLTLVIGTALGLVFNERRKNARIKADVEALKRFGCSFIVENKKTYRPMCFDGLFDRNNNGIVTGLNSEGAAIPNAELVHLKSLTNLDSLVLTDTAITDAGLVHLKSLTNLNSLVLAITAITDAGLVHLKGLKKINYLDLHFTSITDAGLIHLKGLTNLSFLDFRYTAITDAGLEHLKGLAQLIHLDLRGTKTTKGGIAELQKALPNCNILCD